MPTTKRSPSNRRSGALIDVVVVAPASPVQPKAPMPRGASARALTDRSLTTTRQP